MLIMERERVFVRLYSPALYKTETVLPSLNSNIAQKTEASYHGCPGFIIYHDSVTHTERF